MEISIRIGTINTRGTKTNWKLIQVANNTEHFNTGPTSKVVEQRSWNQRKKIKWYYGGVDEKEDWWRHWWCVYSCKYRTIGSTERILVCLITTSKQYTNNNNTIYKWIFTKSSLIIREHRNPQHFHTYLEWVLISSISNRGVVVSSGEFL